MVTKLSHYSYSMPSHIQSVIFKKSGWTTSSARQWLRRNQIHPIKHVHVTKNYYRYRTTEPEIYKRFTMLSVSPTIKFVIGWK